MSDLDNMITAAFEAAAKKEGAVVELPAQQVLEALEELAAYREAHDYRAQHIRLGKLLGFGPEACPAMVDLMDLLEVEWGHLMALVEAVRGRPYNGQLTSLVNWSYRLKDLVGRVSCKPASVVLEIAEINHER